MNKVLITLFAISCFIGCQDAVQQSNDWLAKPATTQPGSATHEQVITGTTTVLEKVVPAPFGGALSAIVTGGLILLHNLDSRNRSKATQEEVKKNNDDVTTKITDLTTQVNDLIETVKTMGTPPKEDKVKNN